jgi:hypothetical protein
MNGKQLKRWALLIHDDAQIQIDTGYSHQTWGPVNDRKIRAFYELDIRPTVELEDCNNLEDAEAQP